MNYVRRNLLIMNDWINFSGIDLTELNMNNYSRRGLKINPKTVIRLSEKYEISKNRIYQIVDKELRKISFRLKIKSKTKEYLESYINNFIIDEVINYSNVEIVMGKDNFFASDYIHAISKSNEFSSVIEKKYGYNIGYCNHSYIAQTINEFM